MEGFPSSGCLLNSSIFQVHPYYSLLLSLSNTLHYLNLYLYPLCLGLLQHSKWYPGSSSSQFQCIPHAATKMIFFFFKIKCLCKDLHYLLFPTRKSPKLQHTIQGPFILAPTNPSNLISSCSTYSARTPTTWKCSSLFRLQHALLQIPAFARFLFFKCRFSVFPTTS